VRQSAERSIAAMEDQWAVHSIIRGLLTRGPSISFRENDD